MSASTLLISLGGNLKYVKIEGKLPVEIDGRFKFLVFYKPLSFVDNYRDGKCYVIPYTYVNL
jgi:hypothetical protein